VYWGSRHDRFSGIILGFIVGFLQDMVGGSVAGSFALSKSIACFVSGSLTRNRYEVDPNFLGLVLFVASLTHHLVYAFVEYLNVPAGFLLSLLRYVVPTAFYTVLIGVGAYYLTNWMPLHFRRQ
jgi:rod shape-determining protein MreD